MSLHLRIVMFVALIVYFSLLYKFLKSKRLALKYTLLWIALGAIMVVTVLFPGLLELIAGLCGIADPMNGLFALVCFCILIILMSLTAIVSKLNEKNKILIQEVALLEKKLRALAQNGAGSADAGDP